MKERKDPQSLIKQLRIFQKLSGGFLFLLSIEFVADREEEVAWERVPENLSASSCIDEIIYIVDASEYVVCLCRESPGIV